MLVGAALRGRPRAYYGAPTEERPYSFPMSMSAGRPRALYGAFTEGRPYSFPMSMSALNEIKFGTDGWRALIAREYTFANLERVSQAYADFLLSEGRSSPLVVVGYDRRFMSENFAERAAEVLTGNGFQVGMFAEAQPTPLISWAVKDLQALGGVVITASHNPPDFNGFKIKAPWGGSAPPETTAAVERRGGDDSGRSDARRRRNVGRKLSYRRET